MKEAVCCACIGGRREGERKTEGEREGEGEREEEGRERVREIRVHIIHKPTNNTNIHEWKFTQSAICIVIISYNHMQT